MDRKTDLRLWAVLFWLAVWQIAAMALAAVYPHGELLLASPADVLLRLGQLAVTAAFWRTVAWSAVRIFGGFLLATVLAVALAALAAWKQWFRGLMAPLGTDYEEAKAAAMLTALGLTWETGKPVGAWSGGMKRRLALARALLAPSEAIALDEPFTGLDDENRQRAIRAIRRVAETKPVLLVTHDRTELNLLRANIVNL